MLRTFLRWRHPSLELLRSGQNVDWLAAEPHRLDVQGVSETLLCVCGFARGLCAANMSRSLDRMLNFALGSCRRAHRKMHLRKMHFSKILQIFGGLVLGCIKTYQNEILQENMRLTAFFKLYKICILLHHCNLKILAKNRFEKSAIFVKIQQTVCKCRKVCKILQDVKNFS